MAVAARKKKSKSGSGWSWRLAGIALCAFFALGVMTGLSQSGRMFARRLGALLGRLPHSGRSQLIPAAYRTLRLEGSSAHDDIQPVSLSALQHAGPLPIALVERSDGFYELVSGGELRGPISLVDEPDLPVLSGAAIENAQTGQLLELAGQVIRAEARLSAMLSEMRIDASGGATLFLDRPQIAIALAPHQFPLQLARAAQVLSLWRGRRNLLRTIDMTAPGQAVVTTRIDGNEAGRPSGGVRLKPMECRCDEHGTATPPEVGSCGCSAGVILSDTSQHLPKPPRMRERRRAQGARHVRSSLSPA
jgi:hypothetical protein